MKKKSFGPSFCDLGFCYHNISGKLIVGLDNYNLSDLIYFSVISQKSKFKLHKNLIAAEHFITEPDSFWLNLKPNNFTFFNLAR